VTESELAQFTDLDFISERPSRGLLRGGSGTQSSGVAAYSALDELDGQMSRRSHSRSGRISGKRSRNSPAGTLAVIARRNGIAEFRADGAGGKLPMIEVFSSIGFQWTAQAGIGYVFIFFPDGVTEEFSARQLREDIGEG